MFQILSGPTDDTDVSDVIALQAVDIISQIAPALRGEQSMIQRPSDVRVLLKTADLSGQEYEFPNHGHPDNDMSLVAFDGQNAIVIMPVGDNPRRQLFSGLQIIGKMKSEGLDAVTPEFMNQYVVKEDGLCRQFAAQAYGPAPFAAQAARFVECGIPAVQGGLEMIKPVIESGYAIGMRAPVREEAFLVIYDGIGTTNIKAGEIASAVLATLENSIPASLRTTQTAVESMDGLGKLQKGIVLAIDSADQKPKPLRLGTARAIFDLARMNVIHVNEQGKITRQYLNVTPNP